MEYERSPYDEVTDQVGLHQMTNQGNLIANQNKQLQYQMEEVEKNLAEAQLDCEETLTKINHLLKQDVLRVNKEGILEWQDINDLKKLAGINEFKGYVKYDPVDPMGGSNIRANINVVTSIQRYTPVE
jgi:hypothetical protein